MNCVGLGRGRMGSPNWTRTAGAVALAAAFWLLSTASASPSTDLGRPGARRPAAVPGPRSADEPAPTATPPSHDAPPLIASASAEAADRERRMERVSLHCVKAEVGLRVHPAVARLPEAVPGVETALAAPITIENSGARPILCTIVPVKPSSIGIKYMRGYSDIPDPTWCKVEGGALALEPGESRSVEVLLTVPAGACNFNKSWCVAFSIESQGGSSLGAAAYPYVYVETRSEVGVTRPSGTSDGTRALPSEPPRGTGTPHSTRGEAAEIQPAPTAESPPIPDEGPLATPATEESARPGCVTVFPAAIEAGDVPAGSSVRAGSLTLRNEYEDDVLLRMETTVPPERGVARIALITPGHKWLEDASWLSTDERSVLLPAGAEVEVGVEVASPSDPSRFNFRWEGFVEVDGPRGPEALVRVRWRTTASSSDTGPGEGGRP